MTDAELQMHSIFSHNDTGPDTGPDNNADHPSDLDTPSPGPSPRSSPAPTPNPNPTFHGHVDIIFSKDEVFIAPTPSIRIHGRFSVLRTQPQGSLYVSWIPYSLPPLHASIHRNININAHVIDIDPAAYTLHPLSLSNLRALKPLTPPLRHHALILVLQSGTTLPPFHFSQGGVKALLSVLRQYVHLLPSPRDAGVFVVNDLGDQLCRSLASMDIVPVSSSLSLSLREKQQHDGVVWSVEDGGESLEQERLTRSGTANVADAVGKGLRDLVDKIKDHVSNQLSFVIPDAGLQKVDEGCATPNTCTRNGSGGDGSMLGAGCWEMIVPEHDDENVHNTENEQQASPLPVTREELYSLLVMTDSPPGSDDDSGGDENDNDDKKKNTKDGRTVHQNNRRITKENEELLRCRVYSDGIAPNARCHVWKILLNLDSSTSAQAHRLMQYRSLVSQWKSMTKEQEKRFSKWSERKALIDKDVRRTDRAVPLFTSSRAPAQEQMRRILYSYVFWNFDLGYCQGMSDIVAPLLVVNHTHADEEEAEVEEKIESETFWMFAAVLERIGGNFSIDSNTIHAQLDSLRTIIARVDPPLHAHLHRMDALSLFFCYRWLLILFKREFAFDQVLRLWDVFWSRSEYHLELFLAAAILIRQRRTILNGSDSGDSGSGNGLDFDGILELCVGLAGQIELEGAVRDAKRIREFFNNSAEEIGEVASNSSCPS